MRLEPSRGAEAIREIIRGGVAGRSAERARLEREADEAAALPGALHVPETVRFHADAVAADAARALGARAFTSGRDVYFGPGAFRPGDAEGRRLIAHELAHVDHQARHPGLGPQLEPDPRAAEEDEDEEDQALAAGGLSFAESDRDIVRAIVMNPYPELRERRTRGSAPAEREYAATVRGLIEVERSRKGGSWFAVAQAENYLERFEGAIRRALPDEAVVASPWTGLADRPIQLGTGRVRPFDWDPDSPPTLGAGPEAFTAIELTYTVDFVPEGVEQITEEEYAEGSGLAFWEWFSSFGGTGRQAGGRAPTHAARPTKRTRGGVPRRGGTRRPRGGARTAAPRAGPPAPPGIQTALDRARTAKAFSAAVERLTPPKFWIEMPATKGETATATGFLRDNVWFFSRYARVALSKSNRFRIEVLGISPIVDKKWIKHHPEHAPFKGQRLVHHHLEQGPWAAAIPEALHWQLYALLHPVTQERAF